MKEFISLFRREFNAKIPRISQEQMQATINSWLEWISSIAVQNKLTNTDNRLRSEVRVLRLNNVITNGPYSEIVESIGGFVIVKAASFDEDVEMAQGCSVLQFHWHGNT